jgi:hypothetical protein
MSPFIIKLDVLPTWLIRIFLKVFIGELVVWRNWKGIRLRMLEC